MVLFPFTKRDANGKIIGNFAAIQREQLLAFRESGLARGPLYVGMCLQVDFPFTDRPFEICVEKFCKRWAISRSQYYLAMEKLRKANFLSIIHSKIFLCFNNPGNQTPIPETGNQIPETENQIPETENQIPETENQIPETENLRDLEPLTEAVFSDSGLQTNKTINKTSIKTFSDSGEDEKKNASQPSEVNEVLEIEIVDEEVEVIRDHANTENKLEEPLVVKEIPASGENLPAPGVDKFIHSDTDQKKYTKATERAIATYQNTGTIPRGMELIQWALEEIGGSVQLYRKSGRILSFKPNDIDKGFLKFLELRLTQNKFGKTANPAAWINAMERDPSRWGELVELVGAWQKQEFLKSEEGKAVQDFYYEESTLTQTEIEMKKNFREFLGE